MEDISCDIVTTTGMTEMEPDLYAAILEGRCFRVDHMRDEGALVVSMGATSLSENQLSALELAWKDSEQKPDKNPFFFNHYVSLLIPIRSDWLIHLKDTIRILVDWAQEYDVHGGCYICGVDDPSVCFREVNDETTYICDNCESEIRNKQIAASQKSAGKTPRNDEAQNRKRGLKCFIPARIILSFVLLPLYQLFIVSPLLYTPSLFMTSPEMFIIPTSYYFFVFIGTYYIYKKKAASQSYDGLKTVTIINYITCAIDSFAVFGMSNIYLLYQVRTDTESAGRLFFDFPKYLKLSVIIGMMLFIFIYPLAGTFAGYINTYFNNKLTSAKIKRELGN